jgi:hypothetical protein
MIEFAFALLILISQTLRADTHPVFPVHRVGIRATLGLVKKQPA